jgi:iron complex transport system permease protein
VLLAGAIVALCADIVSQLPGSLLTLPLNAITALVGAPVIIAVLIKRRTLRESF